MLLIDHPFSRFLGNDLKTLGGDFMHDGKRMNMTHTHTRDESAMGPCHTYPTKTKGNISHVFKRRWLLKILCIAFNNSTCFLECIFAVYDIFIQRLKCGWVLFVANACKNALAVKTNSSIFRCQNKLWVDIRQLKSQNPGCKANP